MGVFAIIVTAMALLPLGFVIVVAIQTGWDVAAPMIFRGRVAELLVNTVLLIVFTVPLCAVLAIALAWLTERTDLPAAGVWSWVAVAPLAIPAFVHSYGWINVAPRFHGLPAGITISLLAYFPFMYLPIAATLRRLDPALEDAAAALGLPPAAVFFRVILPQLRLAVLGGALLVALHLLSEYGLYVMIRFDTFTTAIYDQFKSSYNGPAANMLAVVLVACCLALLGGEVLLRGNARYARLGSGSAGLAVKTRLGPWRWVWLLLPILTAAAGVGVPALTIGRWLLAGSGDWQRGELFTALQQSAVLAIAGGALTTVVAVPIAWLAIRTPGRLSRLLEGGNYIVGALPGVVIALALVTVTIRAAQPLYQSLATILFAYAIMFLPRAIISLRASFAQAPIELEQIAGSLGRSPTYSLWSVTIRMAAPGAVAAIALVGLGILNELTATQMLAPNGTRTLAMAFWSLSSEIDYAAAAPFALVMVVLSIPLTWLLYMQSRRVAD